MPLARSISQFLSSAGTLSMSQLRFSAACVNAALVAAWFESKCTRLIRSLSQLLSRTLKRQRQTYNMFVGVSLAQLVVCWTHNPTVMGSIPITADCFIWDNIFGQDAYLDCASPYPGVIGTWLQVGS